MAATKPPIPVGYAKAASSGTLGPAHWVNVMYYAVDAGAHTPGEVIAAVADAQHDFYADAVLLAALSSDWEIGYTTVTYRDAVDSLVRVRVADAQTGTGNAEPEDAQVAYLINWSTGDPRKGGKPRQYIAGVPHDAMRDSAFLLSGIVTGMSGRLVTWLEDLPTRSIPLQLEEMSFRNANTWRDTAHGYPIIGGTLNPVVATQRRRVDRLRPS